MLNLKQLCVDDLLSLQDCNSKCLEVQYTFSEYLNYYIEDQKLFIGSFCDDILKGYIISSNNYAKNNCVVVSIAIKNNYRRLHLAENLIDEIINHIKPNIKTFYLHVKVSNIQAIAFYKKCGFSISKTKKKYYNNNEDCYVMSKHIS